MFLRTSTRVTLEDSVTFRFVRCKQNYILESNQHFSVISCLQIQDRNDIITALAVTTWNSCIISLCDKKRLSFYNGLVVSTYGMLKRYAS